MKKSYAKPEIVFESFSLSVNIAGTCEKIVNNYTQGICGVPGDAPESNIFTSSMTTADGCQIWNDTDMYDGFCYHAPVDEKDLFNS